MASRTANQKKIQIWFINVVTGIAIGACLTLCFIMTLYPLYLEASFGPVIEVCYRSKADADQPVFGATLSGIFAVAGLVIGVAFDMAMFNFMLNRKKQRKIVQPRLAMIAWRGTPAPEQNDDPPIPMVSYNNKDKQTMSKATVPIKATCLGTFNAIAVLFALFILSNRLQLESAGLYFLKISAMSVNVLLMPLVLLLTVKSNTKKGHRHQQVHPPRNLQYHDDHV